MPNDDGSAPRRLRTELAPVRDLSWAFVDELAGMGFSTLSDFRGRQADALARAYCQSTGWPMDSVLCACFVVLVRFAETGVATRVWQILRAEAVLDRERVVAMSHAA